MMFDIFSYLGLRTTHVEPLLSSFSFFINIRLSTQGFIRGLLQVAINLLSDCATINSHKHRRYFYRH